MEVNIHKQIWNHFFRHYDRKNEESYFQANVLTVLHLTIIIGLGIANSMNHSNPTMDSILTGMVSLSIVSLIFLYSGLHRLVTILSFTGMGLLATLTTFATPELIEYEAYLLAGSHMFIILVSSLITQQKRYTSYTTALGLAYIQIHFFFRVRAEVQVDKMDFLDDTLIASIMIGLTGFVVIRMLQRRQRLVEIAAEETREKEARSLELEQTLREKEALLNEVHHRVKNNLNVAISLMNMQMDSDGVPQSAQSALKDSITRLHSMALVHERLYAGGNFHAIEFKPYIESIFQRVLWSYRRNDVSFEVDVDQDLEIGVDRAIPCGLILNELITNVYKHAYPKGEGGAARVKMKREASEYVLVVSDEGSGVQEANWSSVRSLGLRVVYLLSEQLGGTLNVSNAAGTHVEIRFPLASS